jgi:hypothetical protein
LADLTPSGLKTHDYGTPGAHITHNYNFELINDTVGLLISETKVELSDVELDTAGTEAAGASYTSTEQGIIDNLVTDIVLLETKINALLQILRDNGIIEEPAP